MGQHGNRTKIFLLSATMLAGATPALAQEQVAQTDSSVGTVAADEGNEIVVTATRRAVSLQDTPINITAVGAEQIQTQRLDDIRKLADFTPGVTAIDTGPRSTGSIVLRGIGAGDTSTTGANQNNALAIYLGEVPLYADFKLIDIDRVEALLGPQGTLYGLGTLSGALRYLPKRPNTDPSSFGGEVHARGYGKSHSGKAGYQGDVALNIPIVADKIAFRTVIGYYYDPGFIDYNLLLQTPGTSLAQPGGAFSATSANFNTAAPLGTQAQRDANLTSKKDVNFEKTFTTRNQLLLQATDDLKMTFTYAFQQTKTDGRQANGAGVLGTGRYEGPWRYLEPSNRKSHLAALEVEANLFDFAQLVSATAYTKQKIKTNFDNTDLLLDLDYDYELFPAFSSYSPVNTEYEQINQEVRLVSTFSGPFSFVVGGFYNELQYDNFRAEYTPGYAAFTRSPRIDDLEYISFIDQKTTEKAVFGEASFKITDAWQVTGGIRFFEFKADSQGGSDTPFTGGGRRRTPYPLIQFDPGRIRSGVKNGTGHVYKLNTSYKFGENLLVYGTYSTGYRVGGVNRVVPCPPPPLPAQQNVCALPNELTFEPDRTKNAEIGVRGSFFDRRLTFNVNGFHIKWTDVQVPSQTLNGAVGITINGAKAVSKGIEFSGTLRPIENLVIQGTYAYTDAHLTQNAVGLVTRQVPGQAATRFDAFDGDRLPGSTKNSGTVGATYTYPLANDAQIIGNWTAVYRGGIYSSVGLRGGGERIPSFVTHRATLTYQTEKYDFSLFANNIFDKYAVTAIGNSQIEVGVNDGVALRYYNKSVLTPRVFGAEARFRF
ncbi:TonB-dependent receptor [Sphingomonas profundi]|uniref:TonB-dependent receptor n=1 Tax=Alterirhizorhabdus profundi TaxID=2681549 RepID=UPI0012E78A59|nr:TonB-dependent receptor [Sphingomonas profundi]